MNCSCSGSCTCGKRGRSGATGVTGATGVAGTVGAVGSTGATGPGLSSVPTARFSNDVPLALSDGALTFLTFNSELWDDNGPLHTSASRLTAPVAGKYYVEGQIVITSAGPINATFTIVQNASVIMAQETKTGVTSPTFNLATIVELAAGEFCELAVLQTGGAGVFVSSFANYSPQFIMNRVG